MAVNALKMHAHDWPLCPLTSAPNQLPESCACTLAVSTSISPCGTNSHTGYDKAAVRESFYAHKVATAEDLPFFRHSIVLGG